MLRRIWDAVGPKAFRAKVDEIRELQRTTKRLERRTVLKFQRTQYDALYNAALAQRRALLVREARKEAHRKAEIRVEKEIRAAHMVKNNIIMDLLKVADSAKEEIKAASPETLEMTMKQAKESSEYDDMVAGLTGYGKVNPAASKERSAIFDGISSAIRDKKAEKFNEQFRANQQSESMSGFSAASFSNSEPPDADPEHTRMVEKLMDKHKGETSREMLEEYVQLRSSKMGKSAAQATAGDAFHDLNLPKNVKMEDLHSVFYKRIAQLVVTRPNPEEALRMLLSQMSHLSEQERASYETNVLEEVRRMKNSAAAC